MYSFGVVLLEIIFGHQPYIISAERIHIVKWVSLKVEPRDIRNIIDLSLQGNFGINVALKVVEAAMSCTSNNVEERTRMSILVL